MKEEAPVSAWTEHPLFFEVRGDRVFGILSCPEDAREEGVLLLQGGAYAPSAHHSRLWTELARDCAGAGLVAMRIDYRGVGESTGMYEEPPLDNVSIDEAVAAVGVLRSRGVARVLLVGQCGGARAALAALEHLSEVDGVALVGCPLFGRWQGSPDAAPGSEPSVTRDVSPRFLADFERVLDRDLECLVVYGDEDQPTLDGFTTVVANRFAPERLRRIRGTALPGTVQRRPALSTRALLLQEIRTWLGEITNRAVATRRA